MQFLTVYVVSRVVNIGEHKTVIDRIFLNKGRAQAYVDKMNERPEAGFGHWFMREYDTED